MAHPIAQKIFQALWIILKPQIEILVRELAEKAADRVRELARRLSTRSEVTEEMAKRAAALAQEAEATDPVQAAYQRGRKEAYAEMAQAFGVDAQALESGADELRDELVTTGERSKSQIKLASKKQVDELPAPSA